MAEYRSHDAYLQALEAERLKREAEIASVIRERLGKYVTKVEAERISFASVRAADLSAMLFERPSLLKPLLVACNAGGRAVKRDLGFDVDTLKPKLSRDRADRLAEYLLRLLPQNILIESLVALDLYQWTDSAIRKAKGRWERKVMKGLRARGIDCKKRKFTAEGEDFELDVAHPSTGEVRVGVDVKTIGHSRDIHKRSDEIARKASHLKRVHPRSKFVSVVYYPYAEGGVNVESRLRTGSTEIDEVLFAGDDDASLSAVVDVIERLCREPVRRM